MPDGTPCSQDTYTMTNEEEKGFPRSRGFEGLCVLGYCEVRTFNIMYIFLLNICIVIIALLVKLT